MKSVSRYQKSGRAMINPDAVAALSEWGLNGMAALREQVAVLVVVDVLSFSTALDIALARGAVVYPCADDDPAASAHRAAVLGAELACPRDEAGGGFSLSLASMMAARPGLKLLLPSPNGSRLSLAGGDTPVLAGCLRNAAAVAEAAKRIAGSRPIGVVPAGERWPDRSLRPAIEDLLGAGAILHHLGLPCSPEARIARDAYRAARPELGDLIRAGATGRELVAQGYAGDVDVALAEDVSWTVPTLTLGAYHVFEK
jgi:2-phosphosulfolactate phosphatase